MLTCFVLEENGICETLWEKTYEPNILYPVKMTKQ